MELSAENEKLRKYTLGNKNIFTGFANYQDAENYAQDNHGKLVEVAFRDGNDNPVETNEAGLLENKISSRRYIIHTCRRTRTIREVHYVWRIT